MKMPSRRLRGTRLGLGIEQIMSETNDAWRDSRFPSLAMIRHFELLYMLPYFVLKRVF